MINIIRKNWYIVVLLLVALLFVSVIVLYSLEYEPTVESREVVPEEFQLLSASIETRVTTNNFGGIIDRDKVFHYSFLNNDGKVIFKEKTMYENYGGIVYSLEFKIGDKNRILQYNYYSKTYLVFIMTEEMYSQIFNNVK